ncbi:MULTISPECIES: SURF1 family cytochrome oxidase biogenesis protein [Subtercola]|uniref:SURF1-like protein n=1 Tax=Subtercola vilae TaxID=2056433 RepID=A0A4T2C759_9MICO|nr:MULTISPECIES: SURF1 family cytochrome oxidase biogenesis protein [Subtercola]MEA9984500.1 SURF1 family cytochrome oxidase biogenesis protein [Subtercola sp. RTI3]TIH39432.1 SURF1 family protein [Subtercola vilae]
MSDDRGQAKSTLTVFSVMRRPKWIRALVFALILAAAFAALGQWQLSRAVTSNGPNPNATTEVVVPLEQIATAGQPVFETQDGQMVSVDGALVSGDFSIVSTRLNGGVEGYWVVGRYDLSTPQGSAPLTSVAVALGWASDQATAQTSADRMNQTASYPADQLVGRYVGTDGPVVTDAQKKATAAYVPTTMAISALINTWTDFPDTATVFGGYIVASTPPAGLTTIDSPVPQRTTELNWLNIFYAIEWVIFAGFAIFFWYRLVKDAWERETEESQLEEAYSAPSRTQR